MTHHVTVDVCRLPIEQWLDIRSVSGNAIRSRTSVHVRLHQ